MCEVVKLVWQIGRKVNEGRVRLCARAAALAYNRPASSSSRPPESRSDVMPFALLLALAATAGATALTYLYDEEALLWSRLCAGLCIGTALLGLAGFVFASWLGMTPESLALAGAVGASPLLLFLREGVREIGRASCRERV